MNIEKGIHTFELERKLDNHEYVFLKDYFYNDSKEKYKVFRASKYELVCKKYADIGLKISLFSIPHTGKKIRLIVNPIKLMNHDDRIHIAISSINVWSMLYQLNTMINPIDNLTIEDFSITRIDFTINSYFKSDQFVLLMIKLLKKAHYPDSYEETYSHRIKKLIHYNESNSLCISHKYSGLRLSFYNKKQQLINIGADEQSIEQANGILRSELSFKCNSLQLLLDNHCDSWLPTSQLLHNILISDVSQIFIQSLEPIFPHGVYIKSSLVENKIKSSFNINNTRHISQMINLVESIKHQHSYVRGYRKCLENSEIKTLKLVMDLFNLIGISPITIAVNDNIDMFPSLYFVLGLFNYCSKDELDISYTLAYGTMM